MGDLFLVSIILFFSFLFIGILASFELSRKE